MWGFTLSSFQCPKKDLIPKDILPIKYIWVNVIVLGKNTVIENLGNGEYLKLPWNVMKIESPCKFLLLNAYNYKENFRNLEFNLNLNKTEKHIKGKKQKEI